MPRSNVVLCAILAFAAGASASAATITGTVTDGTNHTPAAGDTVVLIALDQRMQEIARTKTDSNGHFSIDSPDPGMHLIRVDHQGAAYFQPAPPNTPNVNLQVYDVAAEVAGVSTVANVMRVETDGQGLRVTSPSVFLPTTTPPLRAPSSAIIPTISICPPMRRSKVRRPWLLAECQFSPPPYLWQTRAITPSLFPYARA
jgi:5-hydroxyisourate hydrolase-like protein (transthyretin family)